MPRTLPASVAALAGQKNLHEPLWLVKWELATGTRGFSSGAEVSFGGVVYERNRVISIPTFEAGMIDRKDKNFSELEIEFNNKASDQSANFPFHAIAAAQNTKDRRIVIYAYSPDALDAVALWWGYTGPLGFSGDNKRATVKASFFWDTFDIEVPSKSVEEYGFMPEAAAGRTNESDDQELFIPLYYAAGPSKMRPVIYDHFFDWGSVHVSFIVSGIHAGLPFNASDIVASGVKLFNTTPATSLEWYQGDQVAAPGNLSRFPDGQAHTNVAFGHAVFPVSGDEEIEPDDIKLETANGRPLVDTALPSENPALILRDLMRDPNFSLGLAAAAFESGPLTTTSNYVATRYQGRYEFTKPESITDLIQLLLADFHGFITFNGEQIQINCKRNNESSTGTFSTIDSGVAGIRIRGDQIPRVYQKEASETTNKVERKFRARKRNRKRVIVQDTAAQQLAGGTMKKEVSDEINLWDIGGVYSEEQNKILAAIAVREDLSANLYLEEFQARFWDAVKYAPGDIITVRAVDIWNNLTNQTFRIISQSIEKGWITFNCQVYKPAVYNDDYTGLDADLLRDGIYSNAQGRPSDVTPVSLQLIDVVASDIEGKQFTARASFTLPAFDPSSEEADGIFREQPIQEVEIRWRYTDEPINAHRYGGSRKVVQTASSQSLSIDFQGEYFKSRSIEAFFIAIGANRVRSELGYIPDPTKVTHLTANLAATAPTASVAATGSFAVDDYVIIENEICRVQSKTASSLTHYSSGGNRTAYFDTVSIAHPSGTEVSVAKKSYPSLTLALGRRFTYPIVTGLQAFAESDGVRLEYLDPSADNIETFLVYWSTDADALSNASKLGSATPAWYLADPYAPPAGVNLILNDDLSRKLRQSQIGSAGTIVYARVAATNRRNFSSQLSTSVTATSTGATGTVTPGALSFPTLVENALDGDPEKNQARIRLNFATANGQSFTANNIKKARVILIRRNEANTADVGVPLDPITIGLKDADLSATSVQRDIYVRQGRRYRIIEVHAVNGDKHATTTGTLDFLAGLLRSVDSSESKVIPAPSFPSQPAADGTSNKLAHFTVRVGQDGVDIVWQKDLYIEVSYGGGTYRLIEGGPIGLKQAEDLYTSVSAFKDYPISIKRKPGVTLDVRAYVKAVGGKVSATTNATQLAASTSDPDNDAGLPGGSMTLALGSKPKAPLVPKFDLASVTNIKQLNRVRICISNGTNSLNLSDLSSNTGVAGEVYYDYDQTPLPVTKAQLLLVFNVAGGGSANVYLKVELTNQYGSTVYGPSATRDINSIEDFLSLAGAVNKLTVGMTMDGKLNILRNSEFLEDATADGGAQTTLGEWKYWNGNAPIESNLSNITTTAANGLQWNKTNHSVRVSNGGVVTRMAINMRKRYQASDRFYNSLLARTLSGTLASGSVVAKIVKVGSNPVVYNHDADLSLSLSGVDSTYDILGGNLRVKDSPDFDNGSGVYANEYFVLEITVPNGTTLEIDKLYQKRGEQPGAHELRPAESDDPNPSADLIPSTSVTQPDLGTPSGTQGGYVVGSGQGRKLDPSLE